MSCFSFILIVYFLGYFISVLLFSYYKTISYQQCRLYFYRCKNSPPIFTLSSTEFNLLRTLPDDCAINSRIQELSTFQILNLTPTHINIHLNIGVSNLFWKSVILWYKRLNKHLRTFKTMLEIY